MRLGNASWLPVFALVSAAPALADHVTTLDCDSGDAINGEFVKATITHDRKEKVTSIAVSHAPDVGLLDSDDAKSQILVEAKRWPARQGVWYASPDDGGVAAYVRKFNGKNVVVPGAIAIGNFNNGQPFSIECSEVADVEVSDDDDLWAQALEGYTASNGARSKGEVREFAPGRWEFIPPPRKSYVLEAELVRDPKTGLAEMKVQLRKTPPKEEREEVAEFVESSKRLLDSPDLESAASIPEPLIERFQAVGPSAKKRVLMRSIFRRLVKQNRAKNFISGSRIWNVTSQPTMMEHIQAAPSLERLVREHYSDPLSYERLLDRIRITPPPREE
jgi:hypothetical protein